ncbi:MAG: hypothetical protein PHW04_05245 [Candidatus Wallbacteria bacterium]|nr:hypothetical protein [Candidatus Wallbacteria bacterium]
MGKFFYIFRETIYMIKKHKLYFISPILILFALLAVLIYTIGPTAVLSFIYAGL